jgi:hypothetical protein
MSGESKDISAQRSFQLSEPEYVSEVERLTDLVSRLWEEDPDNIEICAHLRTLGSYRVLQGEYAEASYIFRRLKELLTQHHGPYDLSVVEALDWIAVMEILQSRIEGAEGLLRDALALLSECGYPALPMRAKILLHLGHVLIEKGRCAPAEEKLKQAASLQLYWLKTGLAGQCDRSLLCDIMVTLRRLFVVTERHAEVKEIDQIFSSRPDLVSGRSVRNGRDFA